MVIGHWSIDAILCLTYAQIGAIMRIGGDTMGDSVRLSITLPKSVLDRLNELATQYGVSRSALIAVAISEKYNKEGGKDA